MELQRLTKEIILHSNFDDITTKFFRDLLTSLSIDNASLQKSCFKNFKQIKALRLEMAQLFQSIYNRTLKRNEYTFIFHMTSNNELWRHSLQFGLQKVSESVARHNASCKEWKRAAELKLQITQDDFTMMPFHDVKIEINTVDQEFNEVRKKSQETAEKTEASNSALEAEFKQLLVDVATMEFYEDEMRKSKKELSQVLSEIRRQKRLNAFHTDSEAQQKRQTQKDIDDLQKQITALQLLYK